ncbi:MAG: hypothetical protein ABJC89_19285, partial [Acidobacteriota bacterium]
TLDEQAGDSSLLGADWFNYGQFLRRRQAEPHLVLVSLLQAEHLLGLKGDERTATVRTARAAVEREHPEAIASARRSPAAALADARALLFRP